VRKMSVSNASKTRLMDFDGDGLPVIKTASKATAIPA